MTLRHFTAPAWTPTKRNVMSVLSHGRRCGTLSVVLGMLGCGGGGTTSPPMQSAMLRFTSSPPTSVDHNRPYAYTPTISNNGTTAVTFSVTGPPWLRIDSLQGSLSGIAGWDNADRAFAVRFTATNGVQTAVQNFQVAVSRGEIICDQGFVPVAESPYVLPFAVNQTVRVSQGNCFAAGGHNLTFAYDFALEIGDTVRAARAGMVIIVNESFLDTDRASGRENNVFVQHADGTVVRYTHLTTNGALVEVGDRVIQGQAIGLSGNSGATGGFPHLHFAVYRAPGNFTRKYSLPVTFRNAEGPLSQLGEPRTNQSYRALPFVPDGR